MCHYIYKINVGIVAKWYVCTECHPNLGLCPSNNLLPSICSLVFTKSVGLARNCPIAPDIMPVGIAFLQRKNTACTHAHTLISWMLHTESAWGWSCTCTCLSRHHTCAPLLPTLTHHIIVPNDMQNTDFIIHHTCCPLAGIILAWVHTKILLLHNYHAL